jgi:hypothetical protein
MVLNPIYILKIILIFKLSFQWQRLFRIQITQHFPTISKEQTNFPYKISFDCIQIFAIILFTIQ